MLNVGVLFPASLVLADLLGLFALALAPEVEKAYVAAPFALVLLLLNFPLRLKNSWLLAGLAGVVSLAFAAAFFSSASSTAVLSRGVVAAHALLWLSSERERYQYWRLSLAFMEIVLAAILAPETRMFFVIFFFVLVSAFALVLGFLERNFAAHSLASARRSLRPGFLGVILGMASLVFLGGFLLFPLLPRANWAGFGSGRVETGYTEFISFQNPTGFWGGEERTLLRMYFPEGLRAGDAIPLGLLRGKALEFFDGTNWRPAVKQVLNRPSPGALGPLVEVVREAMPTEVLPVPYGSLHVEIDLERKKLSRYRSGEWFVGQYGRNRRVAYRFARASDLPVEDLPRKLHLRVPPGFERLAGVAKKIRAKSDDEKIRSVLAQFADFRAELEAVPGGGGAAAVDEFFFGKMSGHCELFATAAALLFRSMGMPARLVAGFRLTRGLDEEAVSVRNTDAHAWVEVWTEQRGWVPVDPTPFVPYTARYWDKWLDLYDRVEVFWHRYIVGYELEWADLRAVWEKARLPLGMVLVALAFFALARRATHWLARWRANREPRRSVARIAARVRAPYPPDFEREYLRLRFGRESPRAEEVRDFRRLAESLEKASHAADRAERAP